MTAWWWVVTPFKSYCRLEEFCQSAMSLQMTLSWSSCEEPLGYLAEILIKASWVTAKVSSPTSRHGRSLYFKATRSASSNLYSSRLSSPEGECVVVYLRYTRYKAWHTWNALVIRNIWSMTLSFSAVNARIVLVSRDSSWLEMITAPIAFDVKFYPPNYT